MKIVEHDELAIIEALARNVRTLEAIGWSSAGHPKNGDWFTALWLGQWRTIPCRWNGGMWKFDDGERHVNACRYGPGGEKV